MSGPAGPGPRLVGVGVGPGDPDLVTVKAVRVLNEADLVLVPVLAEGPLADGPLADGALTGGALTGGSPGTDSGGPGRAEATVRAHLRHDRIQRVAFALNEREDQGRRVAAWDAAADAAAAAFRAGAALIAFATIGDPNVYSTFTYLASGVRERVAGLTTATVPGITAMQDLAARSGTVLCEGRESLALLPLTAGVPAFRAALARFDTVVGYKSGRHLPEVLAAVREAGRLDDAVHGASLGLPGEDIRPAAAMTGPAPYLSTLLVPARRAMRGGKL
ncbi:MAG: precorrin-2 C20-methyltransferase [Actinomycetia bacterium]|nr:precorrin-2 C20-methyltransferase [Actinomycetes bacterium]